MNRLVALLAIVVGILNPMPALGQGLLVNINPSDRVALPRPIIYPPQPAPRPTPPSSYKIKELAVQVKLADQVAKTQVSQTFVNTGSVQMEVCFVFPLPYDGAIDQMTLLVDGKEFPAKLLDAGEARRMYEEIVRKNRDPALLEWVGTGMFQTSVFPVPPGAERKVTLRYSQVCRQDRGLTDYLFPLSTARYTSQAVEKIDIQVAVESSIDIKSVYSPTHAIDLKRPDARHALVSLSATNQVPSTDFRLLFDVGPGQVGASVISYRPADGDEGYFLLLASPQIQAPDAERPAKTVIFVVDRSGSMSGEKFAQAKGALKFVLNNLRAGDLFNVVAYDSQVESFRPELQKFDEATRQAALGYVDGLYAGGSTNIDGALRTALGQIKDGTRPNYVLFLTDGLPTDGETNEAKIVAAAKGNNTQRARVFAFGVGYDVNSRLLDKLVRENFGQSEYVRPSENIESRVSSLYNRIGSPVLTDVSVRFELDGAGQEQVVSRVYPGGPRDLFVGEQLVLVGRYRKGGAAKVTLAGKLAAQEQQFHFPAVLAEQSGDQSNAFVARLWAMRRVGEIIDEIDLKGRNEELVKELIQLATRHGILTPYTAFLANEAANPRDLTQNFLRAENELRALDAASGEAGFAQRRAKSLLQRAGQPAGPAAAGGADFGLGGRGQVHYYDAREDKKVEVDTVQTIGGKTFFRRGGRWVDSALTPEQEKQPIQIERFSREYFELLTRHGREAARYFAIDEPVTIELGGQSYAY
jgi:Ca-activated chloride channel family protein